ncbi:ATP-grasp domain-containing protein [Bacillus sp. SM2101]|uniref:ATP-grasp domain-containing protein n=1 Tax=Bacillus sp. SM2101 TaxID=2805366 RepID=UPI001BDDCE2C|nr:ATP-grasp domain-containing protein [Bacillus sp. SM2101]
MNILMIGFNINFFNLLSKENVNIKITVLEEPDLYNGKNLGEKKFEHLDEIILAEYQQCNNYIDVVKEYMTKNNVEFKAVVPGLEYGTPAATRLAREIGLKNSGIKKEEILNDKLLFRNHCEKHGIPQPWYKKVKNSEEIRKLFSGAPIVLKPSNKQGSLGVVKITNNSEIESSWEEVLSTDEGIHRANREMSTNYIIEECIFGEEISTEVFVQNGEILFVNYTDKLVSSGRYSVELGHIVPSSQPDKSKEELLFNINKLVSTLGFENGVMHIEWIINENGPRVIECAGRPAGDYIFNLIDISYGFNPYLALIDILAGNEVSIPNDLIEYSSIQFIDNINDESGFEEFQNVYSNNIVDWKIAEKEKASVYSSSFDRSGRIIFKGENYSEIHSVKENVKKFVDGQF